MQSSEIYQFHVWLRGISPLIWRRLLLRADQSIADLHYALQLAFGWSDCHLNRFRIHGKHASKADEQLFVEIPLARGRRHLEGRYRQPGASDRFFVVRIMLPNEFLQDSRFAHASHAKQQQAWHSISSWIKHEFSQAGESGFRAGVINPALVLNPTNSFLISQR
jgi:hypothetical protein